MVDLDDEWVETFNNEILKSYSKLNEKINNKIQKKILRINSDLYNYTDVKKYNLADILKVVNIEHFYKKFRSRFGISKYRYFKKELDKNKKEFIISFSVYIKSDNIDKLYYCGIITNYGRCLHFEWTEGKKGNILKHIFYDSYNFWIPKDYIFIIDNSGILQTNKIYKVCVLGLQLVDNFSHCYNQNKKLMKYLKKNLFNGKYIANNLLEEKKKIDIDKKNIKLQYKILADNYKRLNVELKRLEERKKQISHTKNIDKRRKIKAKLLRISKEYGL